MNLFFYSAEELKLTESAILVSNNRFLLQLVPAVTELLIAEIMYLQYKDRNKPMFLYINSTGTTRADGETVSALFARCKEATRMDKPPEDKCFVPLRFQHTILSTGWL